MITLIKFNTLSVLNTRTISSKAKNVSSKVGRILKTAEIFFGLGNIHSLETMCPNNFTLFLTKLHF